MISNEFEQALDAFLEGADAEDAHQALEAFQIVAQFFIIHVCPFRADFPEKGAKKKGGFPLPGKRPFCNFII